MLLKCILAPPPLPRAGWKSSLSSFSVPVLATVLAFPHNPNPLYVRKTPEFPALWKAFPRILSFFELKLIHEAQGLWSLVSCGPMSPGWISRCQIKCELCLKHFLVLVPLEELSPVCLFQHPPALLGSCSQEFRVSPLSSCQTEPTPNAFGAFCIWVGWDGSMDFQSYSWREPGDTQGWCNSSGRTEETSSRQDPAGAGSLLK